jgi:hypothetical protein
MCRNLLILGKIWSSFGYRIFFLLNLILALLIFNMSFRLHIAKKRKSAYHLGFVDMNAG